MTDSQLTQVYLVPVGTVVTAATDIETAIAAGVQFSCFQTFGDLLETRTANDVKCINTDDTQVTVGSVAFSEIPVEFIFDATNATSQPELVTMFDDKTRRIMIVALNDEPTSGVSPHPTYKVFTVANLQSGVTIALDAHVVYKTNLKICSRIITTLAAETSA